MKSVGNLLMSDPVELTFYDGVGGDRRRGGGACHIGFVGAKSICETQSHLIA
jgi:hypothetical protein